MKPWNEISYYAGFDWAHDHHDVVIIDRMGLIVADFKIEHSAPGWQRWRKQVAALGPGLAACVETSQGMVIEQLLESGVSLYPVSPVSSKAYRQRKVPSGTKTDRLDAWSLADALRVDGHGWKALAKEDPLVAELRLLCRDEVALIEERTALVNQLQSYQSGQIHKVYLRRHCNKSLRSAVHLWANLTRQCSPWAALYYKELRARGKSHACALRCLGQRWLKILWKMWQTRQCYDPELHARNQLKHGSWVLKMQSA